MVGNLFIDTKRRFNCIPDNDNTECKTIRAYIITSTSMPKATIITTTTYDSWACVNLTERIKIICYGNVD